MIERHQEPNFNLISQAVFEIFSGKIVMSMREDKTIPVCPQYKCCGHKKETIKCWYLWYSHNHMYFLAEL